MSYLVIETHGGGEYAIILTDENGDNKVFDHKHEAQKESDDCQAGIVIQL